MPNPIFEDFCKVTCSYDGKFVSVVVEIVRGEEDDVSVIFRRHENESNVIGELAIEEGLIREDLKKFKILCNFSSLLQHFLIFFCTL